MSRPFFEDISLKIYFKYKFKYCWDTQKVYEVAPGTYEVPKELEKRVATLALELGQAIIVPEAKKPVKKKVLRKKAPENKVLKVKRTK